MMSAVSSIPAVKAAVEQMLEAELENAKVVRGSWDQPEFIPRLVVIGGGDFEHDWGALGRPNVIDEEFTIELGCSVVKIGAVDYVEVEDELWELVSEVEAVIRGNHKLGGIKFGLVSSGDFGYGSLDKGKAAEVTLKIAGTARLNG